MTWQKTYEHWKHFDGLDAQLKTELVEMEQQPDVLEEAFYKDLTFGTGGMRGVLGPGTNRMNKYTVRKAVKGLAMYLLKNVEDAKEKGVAVAYDSRYMSAEFALETAKVLGANGIRTYIYESLRPTPYLSFAVRHLGAAAGSMITASHNPPEYNGFKVYNADGGQTPPEQADEIIAHVNSIENELEIDVLDQKELEAQGLLKWVGSEVDEAYLQELKGIVKNQNVINEQAEDLKIVFTPLHGTAYEPVLDGLKQLGFKRVYVVEEQAQPDPEFSTVESPNPEEHQAFEKAIEVGKDVDADLLIATDPDADRLGVAVKNEDGEYTVLTGNQLGTLMIDYLLSQTKPLPHDAQIIKTIVTTEMGRAVADSYGANTLETLTGFKFIGEKIREFEVNQSGSFVFGYEESYGYLIGDFVRDKDAVQAAMTACEMAAYWKSMGQTLYQALFTLYERHGYYLEGLQSMTLKGRDGIEKIQQIMNHFRGLDAEKMGPFAIEAVEDYHTRTRTYASGESETIQLPDADVVKFQLSQDSWCCLRPSGTEPKIKCYFGVTSNSYQESEKRLAELKEAVVSQMNTIIESPTY
ncbi:phospho-sugar mutase [Pontibacillus yanchengensis]|uniref:Phosphoglucomutase n=1 Tax=Pontibacillus yanchengensis TaxID=462910 RepID=A0A6I4ZZA4_9BACI|nr:phospho-sugar mutase [Pontibacillus yanchengensis]MYL34594.1 phospho-sugar mutase [Pontibacillus yanchengensis]